MKTSTLFCSVLIVLTLCLISCSGEDGEPGIQGFAGENGINCWDLNGDGEANLELEDINQDGKVNVLDCMGMVGGVGSNGVDGINCWDLDRDGEEDLEFEDINGDGKVNILDCRGADGNDIDVLEDFTEYGSITVEMIGTRPDGVPFQESIELKLVGNLATSSIIDVGGNNGYDQRVDATRFLALGNGVNDIRVGFYLQTLGLGQDSDAIKSCRFNILHYIIGEDNKYFVLNANYNLFDLDDNNNEQDGSEVGTSNVEFTDAVFDDITQRLSFSYAFLGAAANNNSGHDLNVSGTVDVVLFERVN